MRVRALIMAVMIAGWTMPAMGHSCLSDAEGSEAHGHADVHGAPSHSHPHNIHSHPHDVYSPAGADPGNDGHHAAESSNHAGAAHGAAGQDEICCERASDTPAVEAALEVAQPRPKILSAAFLAVIAVAVLAAAAPIGAQLRQQQPPRIPYSHTRRPLLI